MNNNDKKSPHILSTSSNLLGFCFIVLTSIKVLKLQDATIIDDITSVAVVFFMLSSMLSFLAMRSGDTSNGEKLEKIADGVFFGGLLLLFLITMLITFNQIR